MNHRERYLRPLTSLVLALSAALTGCQSGGHFSLLGYTTEPTFDTNIRSVYFPIPQNTTYRRGIDMELHKAVARELGTSPYRLVSDRARADTELELRIVANRKTTILQNELGEPRDAEVALNIEVIWRDLRPGHGGDILSNPRRFDPNLQPLPGAEPDKAPTAIPLLVTPTAGYRPELGASNTSADRQMLTKAARQIVTMMEVWR